MKNFTTFELARTGLISLFGIGGLIFAVAFMGPSNHTTLYRSMNSNISIFNPGEESDAKVEASTFACDADLTFEEGKLTDISSFNFAIPINEFKSNDEQLELTIQNLFRNRHGEVTFKQQRVMVLPIMKMMHLVGELTIANATRPFSFQFAYEINKDQTLTIKGKQTVNLTEFGILLPNLIRGNKNEIDLNFDLKMVEDKKEIL